MKVYDIKKIRLLTGMNRKQFAEYFDIPYRTVEDWEAGRAKCAPYLAKLIIFKLEILGEFKDEKIPRL